MIAFVITDKTNFGSSDQVLPEILSGGTDLPPQLASLSFKGRNCYVLIYSFERDHRASLKEISNLSATAHLRKAGVWNVLIDAKR